MYYLDFIEKDAIVYHTSYGSGVVTSGEIGSDFQVKFERLKRVKSFRADGVDMDGGVKRSIFQNEVKIIEDSSKERLEVIFDPVNNNVGMFNSTRERKYLVFAIQALVENLASDTNISFDSAIDEIKIIHSTMGQN